MVGSSYKPINCKIWNVEEEEEEGKNEEEEKNGRLFSDYSNEWGDRVFFFGLSVDKRINLIFCTNITTWSWALCVVQLD